MGLTVKKNLTCKVCEGNDVRFYLKKDNAAYHVCKECGLIFQDPIPKTEEMLHYANTLYEGGEYRSYVEAKNMKHTHFRNRLKEFQKIFPNGRLLDIGCSCGYFLDIALENGYDAYGIEFSDIAIAAAEPRTRERIMKGTVNTLDVYQLGSFDLVTAFDIIEHTEDPVIVLRHIKSMLKPNGGIVLTMPDTGHILRYLMGSRWPMFQPMQHTVLFSAKSLRLALEKAGFIDIQITAAYKTITIDYLLDQVKSWNPTIFGVYRTLKKMMPENILTAPRNVNISEIMGIGRNKS